MGPRWISGGLARGQADLDGELRAAGFEEDDDVGRTQRVADFSSWAGHHGWDADSEMFLDGEGRPKKFHDAVKGGLSVGTPSLLKMLKDVHQQYGKLPWHELFYEAIRIAREGFPMDEKIYKIVGR